MNDSIINVVRIVAVIVVLILTVIFNNQFDLGILSQIIGFSIGIVGLLVWIAGRKALGKNFTSSITPKGLVTEGIYSKIRHPLYSGVVLIFLGTGFFFESIIGLILTVTLITLLMVYAAINEEKLLLEKYGEKYIEYKKKTIF